MRKSRSATAVLDAVALVILGAETALVAVMAIGYMVYALVDRSFSSLGLALAAVMAILAAGLGLFTRGFARRRRFALGGAMTWQLMQASVGVWLLGTFPAWGTLLIVAAVIVAVAVFMRQAALGRQEPGELAE